LGTFHRTFSSQEDLFLLLLLLLHTHTHTHTLQVLNNVDALSAELAYLIKQADAGVPESNDDLFMYLEKARDNFDKYLSNIDKQDVAKARDYVSSKVERDYVSSSAQ
jgi:hypothetical protein